MSQTQGTLGPKAKVINSSLLNGFKVHTLGNALEPKILTLKDC